MFKKSIVLFSVFMMFSLVSAAEKGGKKFSKFAPPPIVINVAKEKPQMAEIVAVGPGGIVDGKEVKMELSVGDKVITSKYAGTEVKLDGVEYTILRQSDVLAKVE